MKNNNSPAKNINSELHIAQRNILRQYLLEDPPIATHNWWYIDGYFKNLAAAATNKKSVLEELITNLTILTNSNDEMTNIIKNHWRTLVASATAEKIVV